MDLCLCLLAFECSKTWDYGAHWVGVGCRLGSSLYLPFKFAPRTVMFPPPPPTPSPHRTAVNTGRPSCCGHLAGADHEGNQYVHGTACAMNETEHTVSTSVTASERQVGNFKHGTVIPSESALLSSAVMAG